MSMKVMCLYYVEFMRNMRRCFQGRNTNNSPTGIEECKRELCIFCGLISVFFLFLFLFFLEQRKERKQNRINLFFRIGETNMSKIYVVPCTQYLQSFHNFLALFLETAHL